ncbi:MAG: cysteine desulfurase [Clostridiales bacterium]|nr:cysteine desulfurase [Clostridiales bacterium]
MIEKIYLDNAATTQVSRQVADGVFRCLTEEFGNPSSLHHLGLQSERLMKDARNIVAGFIRAEDKEIIFTSGGTESNNLGILGAASARKRFGNHCITTQIEHSSVLNTFAYLQGEGWDVTYLSVDKNGSIDIEELKNAIKDNTVLVSIGHVNSEIGSIQPLGEIGLYLKRNYPDIIFHTDSVQSFGRLDLKPGEWGIDLLSASGHKIHAPKGIGILYVKNGISINPRQWGGGQEWGIRSGTENLPGIVGLGKAVSWIKEIKAKEEDTLSEIKAALVKGIFKAVPEAVINGPEPGMGAPHIVSLSIPGIKGETLMHVLETHGVYVSTGSACSSRKSDKSHVLSAIGADKLVAEGTIRISLSYLNTLEELSCIPSILRAAIDQVKKYTRR